MAPDLPAMDSISMPMVIREGKAWGFMSTSGLIPDNDVNVDVTNLDALLMSMLMLLSLT
jgi:hypothetical protein